MDEAAAAVGHSAIATSVLVRPVLRQPSSVLRHGSRGCPPCFRDSAEQASIRAGAIHELVFSEGEERWNTSPYLSFKQLPIPAESRPCLTRKERLARWAEALERDPKRRLRPL